MPRTPVPTIAAAPNDEKDFVRFTAAACVAHLAGLPAKKAAPNAAKP